MPSSPSDPAQWVDTVIVGSGPAALILSYILHGHIPHYRADSAPHPDALLRARLPSNLCDVDARDFGALFEASRLPYSTAALPINVLVDTLLRPLADVEPGAHASCVEWRHEPDKAVTHRIIGDTVSGGMWASNPVPASADIGALSYVDQLALPGFSLADYLRTTKTTAVGGVRPSRQDVADYLIAYPAAVGIDDAIAPPGRAQGIQRFDGGFFVFSHHLRCQHLVLASGTFSNLVQPDPFLQPLMPLPMVQSMELPLLVIGSGFTAADILMTQLPKRKILHVFQWDPEHRPSPLRACHRSAYPDYAGVYRRMKRAAAHAMDESAMVTPLPIGRSDPFETADAESRYEGLPNASIEHATFDGRVGRVRFRLHDGTTTERIVSGLQYVVGRRGSLSYLDPELQSEVLGPKLSEVAQISGGSLREKVAESTEVAPNVFAIGSLAGDSLIRFAYGTCVSTAGMIMARRDENDPKPGSTLSSDTTLQDEVVVSEDGGCCSKVKTRRSLSERSGPQLGGIRRRLESIMQAKCILQ